MITETEEGEENEARKKEEEIGKEMCSFACDMIQNLSNSTISKIKSTEKELSSQQFEMLEKTLLSTQRHLFSALSGSNGSQTIKEFVVKYSLALFDGCKSIVREIFSEMIGIRSFAGQPSPFLRFPSILPPLQAKIEAVLDNSIIRSLLPQLIICLTSSDLDNWGESLSHSLQELMNLMDKLVGTLSSVLSAEMKLNKQKRKNQSKVLETIHPLRSDTSFTQDKQWRCSFPGASFVTIHFDKRSKRPNSTLVITGGEIEEHTSELQSPCNLVCRLLLEKKKKRTL
eukprot:TRINITY_DN14035_c0_g1_i2.p1 TRINITY_DN14035_c0_g1~~TRINITY_DN14035_c0_g1_i2.p1  ORF type:complete len:285 (-),score=82.24 TRINITY_DN14035_c0_g1_i2:127-981(-)